MKKEIDPITVEVSGGTDSGKTLVSSIVHDALTQKGFVNVTMLDQDGATQDPYELTSVMAAVIAARPDIMSTPVVICEVNTDDAPDDIGSLDEELATVLELDEPTAVDL